MVRISQIKMMEPERRILLLLSDGLIHTREEIRKAVGTTSDGTLSFYMSRVRSILAEHDCELTIVRVPNCDKPAFRLARYVFATLRI